MPYEWNNNEKKEEAEKKRLNERNKIYFKYIWAGARAHSIEFQFLGAK